MPWLCSVRRRISWRLELQIVLQKTRSFQLFTGFLMLLRCNVKPKFRIKIVGKSYLRNCPFFGAMPSILQFSCPILLRNRDRTSKTNCYSIPIAIPISMLRVCFKSLFSRGSMGVSPVESSTPSRQAVYMGKDAHATFARTQLCLRAYLDCGQSPR